jgi:hypothetical protein
MKKLLLSLSLLLIFATIIYSQIRVGPYVGISGSHLTVGESEVFMYKTFGKRSPVIGLAAEKVLKDHWVLKGSLQWVEQGGIVKEKKGNIYDHIFEVEFQYIQTAIALKYSLRDIYFEIGAYSGFLQSNRIEALFGHPYMREREWRTTDNYFRSVDIGALSGIGVRYEKFDLNLSFRHGFNQINRVKTHWAKERNIALQLTLGYYFELKK